MKELKNIMNMNKNFEKILNMAHPASQETVRRFLDSENTGVVSSAMHESSVYTDVRESHASGDTEQPQALVEGALEKITEDGSTEWYCATVGVIDCKCDKQCIECAIYAHTRST